MPPVPQYHFAPASTGFINPSGIAINATGQYAYINAEDPENTSQICKVTPTGSFNTCKVTSGFNVPEGIFIY